MGLVDQCPNGHALGSAPGCAVPECLWRRLEYESRRTLGAAAASRERLSADQIVAASKLPEVQVRVLRAAIAPLQAKVRELEAENVKLEAIYHQAVEGRQDFRRLHRAERSALAAKNAELARVLHATRNLLARIHRDGGHHTEAVGFVQSCHDAEARWIEAEKEHDRADVLLEIANADD